MLVNQVGLRASYSRIRRQMVQHELPDVLSVSRRYVNEEVISPTQNEKLLDLR